MQLLVLGCSLLDSLREVDNLVFQLIRNLLESVGGFGFSLETTELLDGKLASPFGLDKNDFADFCFVPQASSARSSVMTRNRPKD